MAHLNIYSSIRATGWNDLPAHSAAALLVVALRYIRGSRKRQWRKKGGVGGGLGSNPPTTIHSLSHTQKEKSPDPKAVGGRAAKRRERSPLPPLVSIFISLRH